MICSVAAKIISLTTCRRGPVSEVMVIKVDTVIVGGEVPEVLLPFDVPQLLHVMLQAQETPECTAQNGEWQMRPTTHTRREDRYLYKLQDLVL